MTSAKMIQQYKVALSPGSSPFLLLTVKMKFGRTSRNEAREELRMGVGGNSLGTRVGRSLGTRVLYRAGRGHTCIVNHHCRGQ